MTNMTEPSTPASQTSQDETDDQMTYMSGPVMLRGRMIPEESATANLLRENQPTDWLHMDPWRVLRIQAEFVDGFGALAELGPAISVFGSARTSRDDPAYHAARIMGGRIAKAGHYGGREPWRLRDERQVGRLGHRTAA